MDMQPEVLTPVRVTAQYLPSELVGESKLRVEAAGHADGVQHIRIIEIEDPAQPLGRVFEVVGDLFPAPIAFPYAVQNDFSSGLNPDMITIKTTRGSETVHVLAGPPVLDTHSIVLNPETANATYISSPIVGEGVLCIDAAGHEDGVADIHIEQTGSTTFAVLGNLSPKIGYFPYNVRSCFRCAQVPGTVTVGTQRVQVRCIPEMNSDAVQPAPGTLGPMSPPPGTH